MAAFDNPSSVAAVEAILGFNTSDFLLEVSDAVERALVVGVGEMQRELKAIAAQKGYKAVSDAKLGEACQRLLESMRRHFVKNTSKFELYATRNIFAMPLLDAGGEKGSGSAEQAEVDTLKAKYLEAQDNHARLAGEVRDSEALLKDMRDSLYKVRVAEQQVGDQSAPLAETLSTLNEQRANLQALTKRARGKFSHASYLFLLLFFFFLRI